MVSGKELRQLLIIKLFVAVLRELYNKGCETIEYTDFNAIARDLSFNCDVDFDYNDLLNVLSRYNVVSLGTNGDVYIHINRFYDVDNIIKAKYNGSVDKTYIQLCGGAQGLTGFRNLIDSIAKQCSS